MTATRALVASGDGSTPRVRHVVLDPLGPGDVLVEIAAAAMCRTELMTIDRKTADPQASAGPPQVLGHAAYGTVTEVGPAVRRVAPGDAVVVPGTRQCGRCFYCLNGTPGACDDIFTHMQRRVGVAEDGEVIWSDGGMGTHAERMVFVESNVVRIDGGADAGHLAMLGCGIPSGVGAVLDVAQVRPGQSVAISGCGQLGLWMVQAAALAQAGQVIAIDPAEHRRRLALDLGATHALHPDDDVVERVRSLTAGRGVDVGLEAAGSTEAMEQSFAMTRYGGTVVPTGLESETAVVRLNNLQYSLGSRRIIGSQCGGGDVLRSVPRFERMLASGQLDPRPIVTATYALAEAPAGYDAMTDPRQLTGVIELPPARATDRRPATTAATPTRST